MPVILAIDDNKDNLVVITALLSYAFFDTRIITALSGREGIEKARLERPDVILLDLVMPEMDGFETCVMLKEDPLLRRVPVIILTAAKTAATSRIKAFKLGADAFITKPLDEMELTAQVAAMLRIKRSEDKVRQENLQLETLVKERTKELGKSALAGLNLMEDLKAEIDERRGAEDALRESEDRYRRITEGLSDYLYTVRVRDGKAVETTHSTACEAVTGYTAEEFASNPYLWIDMVPQEEHGLINEGIKNILSTQKGPAYFPPIEHRITRKDGEMRWVSDTPILKFDSRGALISYDGVVKDITEHKITEEALRTSKERAEQYLNVAAEIIISLDAQGNITMLNDSGHKLLGYKTGELLGKNWFHTCLPERIISETEAVFEKLIKDEYKAVLTYENLISTKNGNERMILWHNTLLRNSANMVIGSLSSGEDITDRKLWEESLSAEQERLSVTLRSIGDGVITTDTEGKVVIINKAAEELTGWPQKEALGKPLADIFNIVNETSRKPFPNPVKNILASGEIMALPEHTLLISRDGRERIITDSGAPIKDKNNSTIGVVLVFRDITEKLKMFESMQRADKLDSLGILAGGIAHDFNNMLSGVFGYIELARRKGAADETLLEYLDKSLTVFNRAKSLTQQLLTFSKGGTPIRKTGRLDLLIKESTTFALSGSRITCEYHIAQDLWLCDFDENHIGQVIDNLVINARQAMDPGGKITITACNITLKNKENPALKGGKYVKVSIADTGIGIKPDVIKHIFDPFFTTKQKGNGLGLSTCYSILQKHFGNIEVESELGQGTTFHLFLPSSKQEIVESVSPVSQEHAGRGNILIMDDEHFIREIVGTMLKAMGYTIVEAQDGTEALQVLADAMTKGPPIDGALFDLTVPGGMGGKEAIVEIRQTYPDIPVFVSSGYSDDPVMSKPRQYGFTDSIKKPYRINELAEMLSKYIR